MLEDSELLGIARIPKKEDDRPKCTNCKHYKLYPPDPVLIYSWPKHRCTAITDLVTNNTIETDCYAMRRIWSECGPSAKLFEDAPAPPETDRPEPALRRGNGACEKDGRHFWAFWAPSLYWLSLSGWRTNTTRSNTG